VVPLLRCGEADPIVARLAERTHYAVDVLAFRSRDDGRILVELEVRAALGPGLETLTVTIRQHGANQDTLRRDRVPLDLSDMDATGVLRLYTEIPAHPGAVEALSAMVEREPPRSEYHAFPEIEEVAGL
jgi:hypothetical protein